MFFNEAKKINGINTTLSLLILRESIYDLKRKKVIFI